MRNVIPILLHVGDTSIVKTVILELLCIIGQSCVPLVGAKSTPAMGVGSSRSMAKYVVVCQLVFL